MDRRLFMKSSFAAGAAAPALIRPSTAWSSDENQRQDDNNRPENFQRVSLLLNNVNGAIVLTSLLILAGELLLYLDMQQQWQRFAASRANVSKIPLLGGLTRPTVQKRIQNLSPMGKILLAGTVLIIIADRMASRKPERVTIVNAGNEFSTGKDPRVVKMVELNKRLDRATEVAVLGAYYDKRTGELLALIPPEFRKR